MIDDRELQTLITDLGKIPHRVLPDVDAILKKGANNIKESLKADAAKSRHFSRIAPTISYDSAYKIGSAEYEIGPDKQRGEAAKLANIAYFGGANGGGGTLDLDGPLHAEEGPLMGHLGKLMGGML